MEGRSENQIFDRFFLKVFLFNGLMILNQSIFNLKTKIRPFIYKYLVIWSCIN